ncbi:MAG TPA: CvpA family protein, partial [Acidimicrobiales bacterium]|nr:CvpA family protein [Acidimicrobiales bacterium]
MNLFDLAIGVSIVSALVGGWRLGFVARAFSWAGLACGLYLGVRILPNVLDRAHGSDPVGKLLLAAGVLIGLGLGGQVLGMLVGTQARRVLVPGPLGLVDRTVGSGIGAVGVLVSLWLLLPSMAQVPGWPSQQAHNSAVARLIDSVAPPAPDTLQTVRRLVGDEAFPRVFDALRPAPDAGPPPQAVVLSPQVQAAVAQSSLKIEGEACRRLQQGSGFVVGPDLVATNAHVVAGERRTEAIRVDGRRFRGTVVAFDPDRDLAILRVPGISRAPLAIARG